MQLCAVGSDSSALPDQLLVAESTSLVPAAAADHEVPQLGRRRGLRCMSNYCTKTLGVNLLG